MNAPLVRTRPDLIFTPTKSGRSIQYVVEDPVNNKFHRIGAVEYELCACLDGTLPLPVAMSVLQSKSKLGKATSPEKLQKIVSWILQSGLVEECSDSHAAQAPASTKAPPTQSAPKRLFDPSFFRIRAISPELMEKLAKPFTWIVSWPALFVALGTWIVAIGLVIQNGSELTELGKKLFVPGSQWWLLIAWLILKAVHESGHGIACVRVGARPSGAGIGFMFFTPTPYVDVTGLWRVENRWSRILVSAAGMLFEMTFSALAIIVACSVENSHVRFLAVSIASLGTLTTLAFNANPLMRYDGYYMFIDAINRPNLWQDANQCMRSYFASWLFKQTGTISWTLPLLAYGIASWMSRITLLIAMGWGVLMAWDGIGLLVVAFFCSLWFIIPLTRKIKARKPTDGGKFRELLAQISPRKAIRCSGLAGIALCGLFLPSPIQLYWPATVDYVESSELRATAPGFVNEVLVHDGQGVKKDDPIIILSNPQLELELSAAETALKTSTEKCNILRSQRKLFELQAEDTLRESLEVKAQSLRSKVATLRVCAPRDGVLLCRNSHQLKGSFLNEGYAVGMVVDPNAIEIHASVPQASWELVATQSGAAVEVYPVNGRALRGTVLETLPRTSDELESPALGGLYGGPIPVVMSKSPEGEDQLKTEEPRLTTRIEINTDFSIGRHMSIRYALPAPGSLCSVCLTSNREAVWETAYRWGRALVKRQIPEATGSQ